MLPKMEFKESSPDIGLITRTPRQGPELDMVTKQIPHLLDLFSCRDHEIAVFWEPKVDVGFPDLVLALYSSRVFAHWSSARRAVTTRDLKLVQHMHSATGVSSTSLERLLGLSSREVLDSVERLLDARLITRFDSRWHLEPFSEIFGIRRLIAVEAKLSNWAEAFFQAETNAWFASESYVLSPVSRPKAITQDRSAAFGVGLLACGTGTPEIAVTSGRNRLPASYASWQFNEWIGRELSRQIAA